MATAAGSVAIRNSGAIEMVNKRVSDLDDYRRLLRL